MKPMQGACMYRNCILILLLLGLPFVLISCPGDGGEWLDTSPWVIGLQFTVVNNFNEEVQIRIRHVYDIRENKHWRYSDWTEAVTILSGGSQIISNENTSYKNNGKDETMSGFILWSKYTDDFLSWDDQTASFEISVQTGNAVNYIAGFETDNTRFAETGFGEMKITSTDTHLRSAHLKFNEKAYPLRSAALIPATLTINAAGSYSIEYDEAVLRSAGQKFSL
jgi:hypothetical protein